MSFEYLKPFTTNGQTTQQGQINAGNFERTKGWTPAPQQSNESWTAYQTRVDQSGNKS